jgi:uncharacterized protein YfaP (DUF2135 family)
MKNTLILLLLLATLALASCGGKGVSLQPLGGADGSSAIKLTMIAEDGKTIVPVGGPFSLAVEGNTVRVNAQNLEGLERSYFRIVYPASSMSPLEAKAVGLISPDSTVSLCYTGNEGEVILGFATIDGKQAVTGSGTLFEVTFANSPFDASKAVLAAPTGSQNRVTDLAVQPVDNTSYSLTWTERNTGDYNVDGDVNVADVTPIAANFGKRVNDGVNDVREIPVDGDGDHTVGITDVTPLAMNYGNHLDGYIVYRREGIYAQYAAISPLIPRENNNGDGVLPTYGYSDTTAPTGAYISYEVRPVDNRGAAPEEGTSSRSDQIDPAAFPGLMSSVLAADPTTMGDEEVAQIFESYLFLFGGTQLGVVDDAGNELSSNVVPEDSYMSLRHSGAIQLAQNWQIQSTIEPYKLGEVFNEYILGLEWDTPPTIAEFIALQQEKVNEAWANLSTDPGCWAIVLQFNQGPTLNTTPPVLTEDTPLNVFQAWALSVSFIRWADNEGKAVTGYDNILTFYPNMPGTFEDAGNLPNRLYNQWSSTSFTRRVIHAAAGAGASAGLAVLIGGTAAISLPVIAGVAVFSFIIKPPAAAVYDVANNAFSNFSTPVMVSVNVETDPIPETNPPQHLVRITWGTGVPMGGDGGPSFEIIRAESADGPWTVVSRTHNSVSGVNFNTAVNNGDGTYTDYETSALSGKTYIYKVQRRDMRWGPDNVVMSANSITAQIPAGPSVIGLVHDTEGTPLPNINVATSDGTKTWTDKSDSNGHFKLVDITPGQRVISFSARGFASHLEQALIGPTVTALDITLPAYVGDVTQRPVIDPFEYNQSEADITNGLANITGRVMNLDGPKIILIQNGQENLLEVDSSGYLNYRAVLVPGQNKFKIRAVNALGETISDELTIVFAASFLFRVTLTWNQGGGSDIDLYTKDPSGDVSYYSGKVINSGSLDVDNTSGYGPENFTCNWDSGSGSPEVGSYQVGVNYYSDHQANSSVDPPILPRPVGCAIRVVLNPQTPNEQTLFYSGSVTVPNGGSDWFGGGGSWWNPVTISVDALGVATAG